MNWVDLEWFLSKKVNILYICHKIGKIVLLIFAALTFWKCVHLQHWGAFYHTTLILFTVINGTIWDRLLKWPVHMGENNYTFLGDLVTTELLCLTLLTNLLWNNGQACFSCLSLPQPSPTWLETKLTSLKHTKKFTVCFLLHFHHFISL
jgi:hypothetical protein